MTYRTDQIRRAQNRAGHDDVERRAKRILTLRRALRAIRAHIKGRLTPLTESVAAGVLSDIDRIAEAALKGGDNFPDCPFIWEAHDDEQPR